jgi:hypothetical protein
VANPGWRVAIPNFLVGLGRGAAIGLAGGLAVGALIAAAPVTVPYVIGVGGLMTIQSAYQWAQGGYQVTAEGAGEFIGGFAGGGLGGRLGSTLGRAGRSALQEMLNSTRMPGNGAFAQYMQTVQTLDVSSAKNSAVFYSGSGNRALAENFATSNGRTTLEMTRFQ